MGKKTLSGKKSVQSGKQVAVVAAHRRGAGRKIGHAKGESLSRQLAPWRGQGQLAALNPQSVIGLLYQAVKNKAGIEVLERLMALQVQAQERIAKQLFFEAMARFQQRCPVIPKRTEARDDNGNLLYKYAEMDAIVLSTAALAGQEGFSWIIKTPDQSAEEVGVSIEVHHSAGHVEVSTLRMPVSGTRMMSPGQKIAATETLAKRHVYCNAFGITTGYQDKDDRFGAGQANNKKESRKVTSREPGTLPENPGIQEVEKMLAQMPWLPANTSAMYRKQGNTFVQRKDETSLRGLVQALSKQIAMKGAKKS